MSHFRFSTLVRISRWLATALATIALIAGLGALGGAAADDCIAIGGALMAGECVINSAVGPKTGTFTIAETLHFTSGGQLTVTVGSAGITINITAGNFVMDANTLIDGNGNNNVNGAPITVNIQKGNVDLKPGSIIRSNGRSGGFIQIVMPPGSAGKADIDGLVESVGSVGGTGALQPPGGGPITIIAGCALTISDAGKVSSRGADPAADLVHLEGCVVVVNGLVESTGSGHTTPNFPPNSCDDVALAAGSPPRRNPVTRPGKPATSNGCVEIWSGTTVLIDGTGTHKGEVNADVSILPGRGWIDIFANGTIRIMDGLGNDGTIAKTDFAVHSNTLSSNEAGLITIKSLGGDVSAVGNAVQADAFGSGGAGGTILVEADNSIDFDGAIVFARGVFGGSIGTLGAPIRAFHGSLSWATGVGSAVITGAEINLQHCLGVTLGATLTPAPNVVAGCALAGVHPVLPAYVTNFPPASCTTICDLPGGAKKQGRKFEDVAGQPGLPGWTIRLFAGGVQQQETVTGLLPLPADIGAYEFNIFPGTYTVCEVLMPGWVQTFPTAATVGSTDCSVFGQPALAPRGWLFTVVADQIHTGNDFGNRRVEAACPQDPTAKITLAVDQTGAAHGGVTVYKTIQAAWNNAINGDVIGLFSSTKENIVLNGDKTVKITQCTNAKVTALDKSKPVWTISGMGISTVVGPEAIGGTIGWLITSDFNRISGVRSTGASQLGMKITGSSNDVSFNSLSGSSIGIRVEGDDNDIRGGTVSGNSGNGVELTSTSSGNTFRTANVQSNGGNGIVVDGSNNTVKDNPRVDSNTLNGILVQGSSSVIKNNGAGSDKGKGNKGDGIQVTGTGTALKGNKANANSGYGFRVTAGGTGTTFKNNQSNQSNAGGSKENKLAEYRLDAAGTDLGDNKADNVSIPQATKCPTFADAGTVCGD